MNVILTYSFNTPCITKINELQYKIKQMYSKLRIELKLQIL